MVVYKIFDQVPAEAQPGHADPEAVVPKLGIDVSDGFYHLSARAEVAGTLSRFFSAADKVYIAHIDIPSDRTIVPEVGHLGNEPGESRLQWDEVRLSDTGAVTYFPHIYGNIRNKHVLKIETVHKNADGTWTFQACQDQVNTYYMISIIIDNYNNNNKAQKAHKKSDCTDCEKCLTQ